MFRKQATHLSTATAISSPLECYDVVAVVVGPRSSHIQVRGYGTSYLATGQLLGNRQDACLVVIYIHYRPMSRPMSCMRASSGMADQERGLTRQLRRRLYYPLYGPFTPTIPSPHTSSTSPRYRYAIICLEKLVRNAEHP